LRGRLKESSDGETLTVVPDLWSSTGFYSTLVPSATDRFQLQPLVCRTVFHHTSLLSPLSLSPSSAAVLNHISSHFLISLSDSSLICTVPAQ